jgi:hypothetical protein
MLLAKPSGSSRGLGWTVKSIGIRQWAVMPPMRVVSIGILLMSVAALFSPPATSAKSLRRGEIMNQVHYRTVDVDGVKIFYREAGPAAAPTILLLHGFPTSSHMFRDLIPLLADR